MRMRKRPHTDRRMEACHPVWIQHPAHLRANWNSLTHHPKEIWLELGCGKGRFPVEMAKQHPEILYLAVERVPDVLVIAMERCMEMELKNLYFLNMDVAQLHQVFAPGEVDRIFLNFSDPWTSNRHAKRRLTHPNFLILYRQILKDGGEIHLKTDHSDLFRYSLSQFPSIGYQVSQVTDHLHANGICGVMTDHEEKFYQQGRKIHRCVASKAPMELEPTFDPQRIFTWGRVPLHQQQEDPQ